MIRISACRERLYVRVEGHAGYAEHGRDIVCAAVSALVFNYAAGLERIAGLQTEVHEDRGSNSITIGIGKSAPGEADRINTGRILFDSLMLGLGEIRKTNPKNVIILEGG
ncbi:MAG: ribosomal-processing cysteine protease Prp [Candidatus Wallbacteria bacterium]|nr:ribosomal-processing cysteine protease Prp [Candidatus Wallbacteria bacterium]